MCPLTLTLSGAGTGNLKKRGRAGQIQISSPSMRED